MIDMLGWKHVAFARRVHPCQTRSRPNKGISIEIIEMRSLRQCSKWMWFKFVSLSRLLRLKMLGRAKGHLCEI